MPGSITSGDNDSLLPNLPKPLHSETLEPDVYSRQAGFENDVYEWRRNEGHHEHPRRVFERRDATERTVWNLPINVKEAARFLGVSQQTVYLWVERKQIPHLRVMGRNIRFLRSDLEPFRAQFKHEVANGKTA